MSTRKRLAGIQDEVQHAELPKLRGRPNKDRISVIDRDIIQAAKVMFGEVGYRVTSMEAIAAQVGIAKTTLYARYPDKQALFKAVVSSIVYQAKTPEPPAFPDLRTCLTFHVENAFIVASDPDIRVISTLADNDVQSLPELQVLGEQIEQDLGIKPIAKSIIKAAARDGMSIDDPEFIASALVDLATGYFHRVQVLKMRNDFASLKFAAERIASFILAGIAGENHSKKEK